MQIPNTTPRTALRCTPSCTSRTLRRATIVSPTLGSLEFQRLCARPDASASARPHAPPRAPHAPPSLPPLPAICNASAGLPYMPGYSRTIRITSV